MSLRFVISAGLLGVLAASGGLVRAEEDRAIPAIGTKEPSNLRELIDQSIESYEVFASADSKEAAEPLIALRWANNARGSEDGTTVLYVGSGRPLAACCVYPWAGRLEHGFESLSREKIVARREGKVVWQPQEPGVKFAVIPEAPAPEESRTPRLRQMKMLAEQFQATMLGWKSDNTDREELRPLSKPLFRYDPKDGPVLDGAVFAFVTGTDPEVLLLIEAVREGERASWLYAFVRRTSGQLEGRWKDKVVWQAARFPPQNDPRKSYYTIGIPLPPAIVVEERAKEEASKP